MKLHRIEERVGQPRRLAESRPQGAKQVAGTLPFAELPLPRSPLYSRSPWFLPATGGAFHALDCFDERIR